MSDYNAAADAFARSAAAKHRQITDSRSKRDRDIRKAHCLGMPQREIARIVGVSHQFVNQVVNEESKPLIKKTAATVGILAALAIAGCGNSSNGGGASASASRSDSQVIQDLNSLLQSKGYTKDTATGCSHSSGNAYECEVSTATGSVFVTVTDDGTTIWESGGLPQ